jgi:hypothetical protein
MAGTIEVNGVDCKVDFESDTLLRWVLSDVRGQAGTKFDCATRAWCRSMANWPAPICCRLVRSATKVITHRENWRNGGGTRDTEGVAAPRSRAMRLLPNPARSVDRCPVRGCGRKRKSGAVKAKLFNTQWVEAGRWPNARTPIVRRRRPN